jgi:hypothetical protein
MKRLTFVVLVLSGLPLAFYPFVILATVMGLAGPNTQKISVPLFVGAVVFQIGALAYPWVYYRCYKNVQLLLAVANEKAALLYSLRPFGYLALLAIPLAVWATFSTS